jgi:polysaccharide biosynthesis transport protein
MSIEFRQKTPGEYLQILNRRKWQVVLPAIAIFIAVAWVVLNLPNYYESTTFLVIRPATISEKIAPSLTAALSQRLQQINQTVLSRSSLEQIVTKMNLFEKERAAGVSIDEIIANLRKRIKVEPEKTDDEKTFGFRLTYRDSNPETAQAVTSELARKYVNVQVAESTQSAETTREFIDQQMSQAKSNLDALEQERLKIMSQNIETLPESTQGLIAQLEGLRKREETISKDKETLTVERGRISESVRALNSQMRLIEDFGQKETQEAVTTATRIEDTPAYGQLIQKRAELSGRLESLKKQYREKHPDVVQVQTDIEKINEELDKLAKNTDQRVKQASQSSARKAELQRKNLEIEKEKAESQISQIESQLRQKDQELIQNSQFIANLEAKINAIPNVKVALEGIDTQYQSAKSSYDSILQKYNEAQRQVQLETNAQGEQILIVDNANLPQTPANASKKPFFVLFGAALGLGFGLMLAAVLEAPRFFRIQNIEDTKYYTGLPVLACVPPLLTEREVASRRHAHWLKVLTGLIATFVSVPVLIIILQTTRIFEKLN